MEFVGSLFCSERFSSGTLVFPSHQKPTFDLISCDFSLMCSLLHNREFKKLRRQLQGKRHIKIELCVKLSLLGYSMLITSYKIGGVHFPLFDTSGFHVKAKNERFTAASSRCRQNLKYEISRRRLADYVKTLH